MPSLAEHAVAGRIDRDLTFVESLATNTAVAVARRAYRASTDAVRIGHSPIDATKAVILGDERLGQPGIAPIMARASLSAYARGRKRSRLEASHRVRRRINLSASDDKERREREAALLLLLLLPDELAALQASYLATARVAVQRASGPLVNRLADSVRFYQARVPVVRRYEGTKIQTPEDVLRRPSAPARATATEGALDVYRPGQAVRTPTAVLEPAVIKPGVKGVDTFDTAERLRGLIADIGEDYERAGFTAEATQTIEAEVKRATLDAYHDGRKAGWDEPEIAEVLWGFFYNTIHDARRTIICKTLDGTTAPKDDPLWKIYTPGNHWGCRSFLTEVYKHKDLSDPEIVQPRATVEQLAAIRAEVIAFKSRTPREQ